MEDNSKKTILVLIFIIIILGCILGFKILNENNNSNEKTHTAKLNHSKAEIIDLIKSENNKSNYEINLPIDDNSKILILQTCQVENNRSGGRYKLVIGLLTKIEKNQNGSQ